LSDIKRLTGGGPVEKYFWRKHFFKLNKLCSMPQYIVGT
jgi:hypothetical protein